MIRMEPFEAPLVAEEVIGKIVFRSLGKDWFGLATPRFVTSVSYSRLYVSKLVDGNGGPTDGTVPVPEDCIGVADSYIGLSTITCVCDTVEEANAVMRMLAAVRTLNGTSMAKPFESGCEDHKLAA
jgi:hypothetical protein